MVEEVTTLLADCGRLSPHLSNILKGLAGCDETIPNGTQYFPRAFPIRRSQRATEDAVGHRRIADLLVQAADRQLRCQVLLTFLVVKRALRRCGKLGRARTALDSSQVDGSDGSVNCVRFDDGLQQLRGIGDGHGSIGIPGSPDDSCALRPATL
jgi:hypothetical protein